MDNHSSCCPSVAYWSSSEAYYTTVKFSYPIVPSEINPSIGIGPTQGQRKTLTRVGFEPTTFEFFHPTLVSFSLSLCGSNSNTTCRVDLWWNNRVWKLHSSVRPHLNLESLQRIFVKSFKVQSNRPIRLTQSCTQFKSLRVKNLCVMNLFCMTMKYSHLNDMEILGTKRFILCFFGSKRPTLFC